MAAQQSASGSTRSGADRMSAAAPLAFWRARAAMDA
jgi:hypothetical protein